jgi:hypothetical protein
MPYVHKGIPLTEDEELALRNLYFAPHFPYCTYMTASLAETIEWHEPEYHPLSSVVQCPWCGNYYDKGTYKCDTCGGPIKPRGV